MLLFVDEYPASLNVRHCLVEQKKKKKQELKFVFLHRCTKQKQVFMLVHVGGITPEAFQVSKQLHRNMLANTVYFSLIFFSPATQRKHSAVSDFNQTRSAPKMLETTDRSNPLLIGSERNTTDSRCCKVKTR